jgi:hypothetical protein
MRKLNYNLAAARKIDGRAFAMILSALLLALLLINALTVVNLARLRHRDRAENGERGSIARKTEDLDRQTRTQQELIAGWRKAWNGQLVFANSLIVRRRFSFIARLNFLEKILSGSMRVRHLGIVNEQAGRITMNVSALAQDELMALYKKLLPYELVITHENQGAESYLANLSFRVEDEKK